MSDNPTRLDFWPLRFGAGAVAVEMGAIGSAARDLEPEARPPEPHGMGGRLVPIRH